MPGDMYIPAYGWTENRQGSLPQINVGWNDSQHNNNNKNNCNNNNNNHAWNNSSHKFLSNQWSSEEPTSLPPNIYQFEVGTPSSSSSSTSSLARSNSSLSFYTKSKPYSWGLSSTASCYRSDQTNSMNHGPRSSSSWAYQGTTHSTNRSCQGSSSSLNTPRIGSASSLCSSGSSSMINKGVDWDRLVDNVFTEEIGLFVQDGGIRNL